MYVGQVSYPGGSKQTLTAGMGHFALIEDITFPRNQCLRGAVAGKLVPWGPFLERPSNLMDPKSYFEIKVLRKIGSALTLIKSILFL